METIGKTLNIPGQPRQGKCNRCDCALPEGQPFGICNSCLEDFEKEESEKNQSLIKLKNQAWIKETLPARYINAMLSDYQDRGNTLAICSEWLKEKKESLFIYGPVGSGKTRLCYALAKEIINENIRADLETCPVMVVNCPAMMESMRPGRDYSLDNFQYKKILMIDDMGREKISEYTEEKLYLITNLRYENCKPTIFTSNHDLKQLERLFKDSRVPSRMAEMCRGMIIKLGGSDRRL